MSFRQCCLRYAIRKTIAAGSMMPNRQCKKFGDVDSTRVWQIGKLLKLYHYKYDDNCNVDNKSEDFIVVK